MTVPKALLGLATAWLLGVALWWLVVAPWLARTPGRNPVTGILWRLIRIYSRLWQRATWRGREILPHSSADHRGLVVVANHTGAADPVFIQAGCSFVIRWMMASDMMSPQLDWVWRTQDVIPVDRFGRDTAPVREAIRYVRAGGAVGIFPEGRITTPPRELRPFLPGVGLLVARTRAPVLLAWISGTPDTNLTREAFIRRGRVRVEFIDLIDYGEEKHAERIAEDLRRRLAEVSGWPLNDEVLPPGGAQAAAAGGAIG